MPQYVDWDPAFSTGHDALDAQHEALIALCNRLGELCAAQAAEFDQALAQLKSLAKLHFEAEAPLMGTDAEQYLDECDEFDFLMNEIATTENFDRVELQRFVALWWLGHVRSTAVEGAANPS